MVSLSPDQPLLHYQSLLVGVREVLVDRILEDQLWVVFDVKRRGRRRRGHEHVIVSLYKLGICYDMFFGIQYKKVYGVGGILELWESSNIKGCQFYSNLVVLAFWASARVGQNDILPTPPVGKVNCKLPPVRVSLFKLFGAWSVIGYISRAVRLFVARSVTSHGKYFRTISYLLYPLANFSNSTSSSVPVG